MSFRELLQQNGWTPHEPWVFRKNHWIVVFDTGSWLEIGTTNTPRIFDVPVPEHGREQWTLHLIAHLCQSDDELQKLKASR